MEPVTITLTVIGTILALFGAYVGIRQLIKWRREPGDVDQKIDALREEIREGFKKAERENPQAALYQDGLAEMPDHRRLSLLSQGLAAQREYRNAEAIDFFRECLGRGVTKSQRIALLILIGNSFFDIGQMEAALGDYKEAAACARESNDQQGLSAALGNLGLVYGIEGELDQALEHHQQALQIFEEVRAKEGVEITKRNILRLKEGEQGSN